jgi:DNA-directed RNA polymerase subunit M/transcription elongation factor TFIIS
MAKVEINCSRCQQRLNFEEQDVGELLVCPVCGEEMTIAAGDGMATINSEQPTEEITQPLSNPLTDVTFQCSHCSQLLVVGKRDAGAVVRCPQCNNWIRVPHSGRIYTEFEESSNEPLPDSTVVTPDTPEKDKSGLRRWLPVWFEKSRIPKLKNDPCYKESVAQSLSTPPDVILSILSHGRNDMVSQLAAQNPQCPPDMIRKLVREGMSKKGRATVALYAIRNPACPPLVLHEVAKREILDDFTREALNHRNMPAETITELAKEGDEDMRNFAISCSACPVTLVNEMALGDRLSRATIAAIKSPKCTPETLVKVLASFDNDEASFAALKNPNCTPQIIHSILMRGEDDELSAQAVVNGRCSKETMTIVLERNRMDRVSMALSLSFYCPNELKRKWREATGQVTNEKSKAEALAKKEREETLRNMRPTGL